MRRLGSEVLGSLFWMGVGIFFALGGLKLNIGTLRNPGPGFLPLIMALILVFFSLFPFTKGLIRLETPVKRIFWSRQALMIASVFFYGLLLDCIGFLLSTFILMSFLFGLSIRGKSRWPKVFFYSVATALAAWVVFSWALRIPFPLPRLRTIWM